MDQMHGTLTLEERIAHDPWSLAPHERRELRQQYANAQVSWLKTLSALVEPPTPNEDFPAFLLETPQFSKLKGAIGDAASPRDLDTATADELQRFVDCYRNYLAPDNA